MLFAPLLLSVPLGGWSSGCAIQHLSVVWPMRLQVEQVVLFPLRARAVASAPDEDADTCRLMSSFRNAFMSVVRFNVPRSSNDDANNPYSLSTSPVTAAWMLISSIMSVTVSILGMSALSSLEVELIRVAYSVRVSVSSFCELRSFCMAKNWLFAT